MTYFETSMYKLVWDIQLMIQYQERLNEVYRHPHFQSDRQCVLVAAAIIGAVEKSFQIPLRLPTSSLVL